MKNSLQKGLMVFITMLCTSLIYSQDISGLVTDASGPLPGVSILVKGTKTETQTDFDGKFTIKNVGSDAVLVFTYIGLKTQEVSVGSKSTINVVMAQDQSQLNEVIVVGYGSVKKKDATGAVDMLSSKQFDNISATSPSELLRGKVSGVQVTQTSGEPGAGVSVRIRGNSSIRSGNNPLYVIDGVPLDGGDVSSGGSDINGLGSSSARNPLNFVNQSDIESISVLKDASSTAIYGSRGANGVIVITTKKGKSKVPQLTFNSSVRFSSMSGDFRLLNGDEFVAAGGPDKGSRSYNWEDAILRSGFTSNNDMSISSGTDKSSTRFSLGASSTDGIVKNTGIDKYTASFNNNNDFFSGALKIETNLLYAGLKDETTLISNDAGYIGNLIGTALYWNPTLPIYQPDGSYTFVGDDYLNPVQLLNAYDDHTETNKVLGSIAATLKLGSHFKYKFMFGVESSSSVRKRQLLPTIKINSSDLVKNDAANGGVEKRGFAEISGISKFNKTIEHTLTYDNSFSDNVSLNALAGFSYYSYDTSGSSARGVGYVPEQTLLVDNIQGGIAQEFRTTSYKNRIELQSYFAKAEVTLYKNLIVTGSIRADGSTKLGADNKWGYFPAVGAAYKVINNKDGALNDIKIRGNFGVTGNQEFPVNSAVSKSIYGNGGSPQTVSGANSELRWETTTSYGIGADFSFLNNRLTGSLDYYKRDTKDLIAPVPQASTQPGPASNRSVNLPGNLINDGVEVSLNYKIIDKEDMSWNFGINAAFLKNKITNFGSVSLLAGGINGQGLSGANAEIIKDGYPLYTYFLYDFKGYDAAGNSIYTAADGSNTGLGNADKKLLDKQPLPKINLGFNTSFTYKNLDAGMSFYGAFGHYLYNNTANAYFFKSALLGGRNVTPEVGSSPQNGSDPNSPSTKYLESGDFLRLGNLTIGYTFKGAFMEKIKLSSARLFVSGENLFVITSYSGFDPEVDTNKALNGVPSAGMDYLSYPKDKSFSVGLNVTF
ncbi:MAG TPA: SusC/RagA family TonB-linked outer membrane protein [Flavobacterium sp.]|uniref:SusC/RagA family TonB-linked outer membrane protein n=1 Tax=Flavobacterium sp. TaxID=239 RepID=UPI002DB8C199|nr:SusC/RagA family TonB-linked outer membrane protein [Flavobacterium sp.]HEU4788684.1 SusC/RagA family TonB-linked outer membrane protein [Flavobacterium sp.]